MPLLKKTAEEIKNRYKYEIDISDIYQMIGKQGIGYMTYFLEN